MEECKRVEAEPSLALRRKLQISNNLFISETHACMDKLEESEIDEYTQLQLEAELLSTTSPVSTSFSGDQRPNYVHSKLPKLELPKFSGNVLKWTEFWDRFHSNIDSQNLRSADKLAYLQASLEGEALATVQGLDSTNENYSIAVQLLKERYGKKGLVLDAHYMALTTMKRAAATPKDCLDTFNDIERHLRILNSMGEDANHNHLRTIILNKFPDNILYELRSRIKTEEVDVETIRKNLEHIITAKISRREPNPTEPITIETLQARESYQGGNKKGWKSFKGKRDKRKNIPMHHDQTWTLAIPEKRRRKIEPCIFCSGHHFNDQCWKPLQERKALLKDKCYRCLKGNHRAKECNQRKKCYHCKSTHHNSAICPNRESQNRAITMHLKENKHSTTLLQTAILEVQGKTAGVKLRALLDTGSQRSYITSKAAHELGLEIIEDNSLIVYTFGSNTPKEIESPMTEIEILTSPPRKIKLNIMPYITEDISCPSPSLSSRISPKLRNKLADDGSLGRKVDILVGNDYYHTFILNDKIKFDENLYLVDSYFGWIWSGKQEDTNRNEELSIITYILGEPLLMTNSTLDRPLRDSSVHKLWDLEAIGIVDCPKATRDDQAVEEFHKSVKFVDGRYWIKWPWIQIPPDLPSNFGLAYGRLIGLLKRMDKGTLENYDAVLKDQLNKGILEEVDAKADVTTTVHYLPHHYVKKGEKLRLVYDASSKSKGAKSLNECLYKGPLLLENLIRLILKFRTFRFGILADVEGAFLQIGIQEEERDVTRSLWLKDINENPSEANLQYLRFCRVPFGIVCSPFLLAITIKHHLQNRNTTVCKKIAQEIYVDNLISGEDSTEGCINLYQETKAAFDAISMNMRDWRSNNKKLLETVQVDCQEANSNCEKATVLGIDWCIRRDTLSIRLNINEEEASQANTKRKILKCIASIFDPCGYASPLLLRSKLFLQNLWRMRLGWDTVLLADLQEEWVSVMTDLLEAQQVEVPRWYGLRPHNVNLAELHCFADASCEASAAVVYLKVSDSNGTMVSLVMSRSRLIPIKNREAHTIPRMELMAIWIGCKLLKHVLEAIEVDIKKLYLWSDSQVALHWLATKRVLPPFVSNRVEEIKKLKNAEFKYIPTNLNPADIATRPSKDNLEYLRPWFEGPSFLKNSPMEWPREKETEHCMLTTTEEELVIKDLQRKHFPGEVHGKSTNLARTLGLFEDNGILRCKGRFKFSDWPTDQKYPILLPKNTDFTYEIIEETHRRMYHVGVSQTLAAVRQKYWIPQGRSQVQRVLYRCKECRKYGGGPYKMPPVAPLPKERVTMSKPFTYTGIDYLGPLFIKAEGEMVKRWACLYTCLAVRAVHLEVVSNLTAEECLLAMRRFIATRGTPEMILSDNATCFKLTAEVMEGQFCIKNKIKWKFIVELAPWFGGVYERLIGLVKHCLRRTIDKHILNESQLQTVLKEIEAVLNCRPLTSVGQDIEHILTPADFLRVGGPLMLEEAQGKEEIPQGTIAKEDLIQGWKRGQHVLNEFTHMFINQYLPTLRERYNRKPKNTRIKLPEVGDVVQIKDEGPRVKWKVGKICELLQSSDKEVRAARVKVGEKEYTRSIVHLYPLEIEERVDCRRENTKEIHDENIVKGDRLEVVDTGDSIRDKEENTETINVESRNSRLAAHKARNLIKQWTAQLYNLIQL